MIKIYDEFRFTDRPLFLPQARKVLNAVNWILCPSFQLEEGTEFNDDIT